MHSLIQKEAVLGTLNLKTSGVDRFSGIFLMFSRCTDICLKYFKYINTIFQVSFFENLSEPTSRRSTVVIVLQATSNESQNEQITLSSPLSWKRRHILSLQLLLTSCFRLSPCLRWFLLFVPDIANQFWQSLFMCYYQSQLFQPQLSMLV